VGIVRGYAPLLIHCEGRTIYHKRFFLAVFAQESYPVSHLLNFVFETQTERCCYLPEQPDQGAFTIFENNCSQKYGVRGVLKAGGRIEKD